MRKRYKLRDRIATIIIIFGGILGGAYVSVWLMIIKPIIAACSAFDAGSLTAVIIGTTILKCIFSVPAGGLVFIACCAISSILFED